MDSAVLLVTRLVKNGFPGLCATATAAPDEVSRPGLLNTVVGRSAQPTSNGSAKRFGSGGNNEGVTGVGHVTAEVVEVGIEKLSVFEVDHGPESTVNDGFSM